MSLDPRSTSLSIGYLSPGWPFSHYPNGIVGYVDTLDETLRAMGHQVTIIAASTCEGDLGERIYSVEDFKRAPNLPTRFLDILRFRIAPAPALRTLNRRGLLAAVRLAIRERQIQILEMEETFGWSEWVRKSVEIPVCLRLHGPWFLNGPALNVPRDAEFERRVRDEYLAIRNAEAITSSSYDVLKQTREFYNLPLVNAAVVHPPTPPIPEASRWRLEGCDRNLILFIGRFDRHKGGDLIIDAFSRVRVEVPSARLRFIGPDRGCRDHDGKVWQIRDYIRHRLPGALESGAVEWVGQQPNQVLDAQRRSAMTTVICSRYENLPLAVVEAAALGCPVVAARAGGIPEVIQDNVTGLLHEPGDVADLAKKIVAMISNPSRAADLGYQAGKDCHNRFHPDTVARRMVEFYRATLDRRIERGQGKSIPEIQEG